MSLFFLITNGSGALPTMSWLCQEDTIPIYIRRVCLNTSILWFGWPIIKSMTVHER